MAARSPTTDRILRRLRSAAARSVCIPADFDDLGTRRAVDLALYRLAKQGKIRRIARGLYDLPSEDPRFGPVPPDLDRVVEAIARRTGSRVQVAGEAALNRLGLSTQVPAVASYRTDGPSRRLVVSGRPIVFRHTVARRLVEPGSIVGTVVEALRTLGPKGIDDAVVDRIRTVLDPLDLARLGRVRDLLPAWQREIVQRIVEE